MKTTTPQLRQSRSLRPLSRLSKERQSRRLHEQRRVLRMTQPLNETETLSIENQNIMPIVNEVHDIVYNSDAPTTDLADDDIVNDGVDTNLILASNEGVHGDSTFICNETFKSELAEILVNVSQNLGLRILRLLRSHRCFSNFPRDIRTVVKTPRSKVQLHKVEPGDYLHIGLEKAIKESLQEVDQTILPNILQIDISTDGANINKCSKFGAIWPIQCQVANVLKSKPGTVGIYRGKKKPKDAVEFFKFFLSDLRKITEEGELSFLDKKLPVQIRCFVGDAPARAFVLGHKSHRSLVPCSKCKIKGRSIGRHIILDDMHSTPRHHEEYVRRVDEDHHNFSSPLSEIPNFDIVKDVVFDYMHLCCLGVMKKILTLLIIGKPIKKVKLCANDIDTLSKRLEALSSFCPREFNRSVGSLDNWTDFKATQYRQMFLYVGAVVFKGIMNKCTYDHFLLFHTSMRVFVSSMFQSNENLVLSEECMKDFVDLASDVYDEKMLTYNFHGLLHLIEDVRRFGPCDATSAFAYENKMQFYRRMCRAPGRSLQQINNRRVEMERIEGKKVSRKSDSEAWSKHQQGPLPMNAMNLAENFEQFNLVRWSSMTIGTNKRDNCVKFADGDIYCVQNILRQKNKYYLYCKKFRTKGIFYDVGIASTEVEVFKCSSLSNKNYLMQLEDVKCKCFRMPLFKKGTLECVNGVFVAMALL